jgi:hypothetical protein
MNTSRSEQSGLCPRGDLDTQSRAFSPVLRLNTQVGEKSPVRGFHALMPAGAPRPVSSGPVGCCPRAAGAGAIPGVTAARSHGQLARSRSVTAVGVPSDGRLAALISALGRPPGRIVQPGYRIPPDLAHRRRLVPRSPVQQPLLPVRRRVRSPACSATDHPFRDGRSLASADTYLRECSHVCVRAKQARSRPSRTDRSRTALRAPILAAAAAPVSFVLTSSRSRGGCPHFTAIPSPPRLTRSGPNW